jgi:NADH-ubiquinone oxidoreductase chain 5
LTGDFNRNSLHPLNDQGWTISKSILGLLSIAVVGGSILSWLIFPAPDIICLPPLLKLLTLFVCIVGAFSGYIISNVSLYFSNKALNIYNVTVFAGSIWFIPNLSSLGIIYYPLYLGISVTKRFDQGWREYFGGQHLYSLLKYFSIINQFLQNNNLKVYLLRFVLWIIVLVSLIIL